MTEPYRFDPWTNKRGSPDNLPEARNFGLRIGAIIARDQLKDEENERRAAAFLQKSAFSQKARGLKKGAMSLAKSPLGGYYNPKTFRAQTKVEVEEVLAS